MSETPRLAAAATAVDDRLGLAGFLRKAMKKVFPDHWTFLLGEIAMYCFAILIITGVFLTFFFKPSATEVIYHGSFAPLRGLRMSEAYDSTLNISLDVRGGLLMRQIHHWATVVFLAAIAVHLLRNFFTGAFRKPRELNWLIGVTLFILAMVNGLFGYSLPDDLLSGTGLRILEGVIESLPIVGTYLLMFLFGGQFPGTDLIPRLFTLHILIIPGILLALIPLHAVVLTWRQTHTQFPGKGRTNTTVQGYPFFPVFMAKTTALSLWVFGVLALMATFFQINPIWVYGPYDPAAVAAGSQPDWYLGFLEGALRIMPNWQIVAAGHTLALNVLIPAVLVPGLLFTGLAIYPFLERWITGDHQVHHLLDRPRDVPARTAIGMAGVVFYLLLWAAGGNDIIANKFHVSLYATTWFFRITIIIGPILAYIITRRFCIGLQHRDYDTLTHGVETGIIYLSPTGRYTEIHKPAIDEQTALLCARRTPKPLPAPHADEAGVLPAAARHPLKRLRARLNRVYTADTIDLPGQATRPSEVEQTRQG